MCTLKALVPFLLVPVLWSTAPAVATLPRWPSLAEQLQQDHVKAGSALEKLIRENQDFSSLPEGCEEGEEGGNLPPWLRRLFHKNHPEIAAPGHCPEGGYPEFLSLIHTWMITHQDLVPGKAQPGTPPSSQKLISAGGDRRISGLSADARSESDIRINPWNPNRILAAANDLFSNSSAQAQLYSLDGGGSWGQAFLPLQPSDSFQGDPAVDWTSDGAAWSTTLGIAAGITSSKLQVYKSTNGGATWTWDSTVPGTETGFTDKEMFWVDHSDSSPYKDNLYVIWSGQTTSGVHVFVSRKNGPAGTWSTPVEISTDFLIGGTNGSDIKSNAFGDVFGFYPRFIDRKLLFAKSTTGGLSFGAAAVITSTYAQQAIAVPAQSNPFHGGTITYISAAAYRTSTKNNVYLVWRDLSGETGCTSPSNAPGTNVLSTCKTRVWFTRSMDGGTTWETSRMLNNQASLNDQFNPHLAVDDTNGTVGVVYYDTVADPGRKKADLWYQSSYDDGVTWNAAVKVTTAQTDETVSTSPNQYGDYNGLSGYNGTFFPSWTDRRNGIEEIWTAPVLDSPSGPPSDKVGYAKSKVDKVKFTLALHNQAGSSGLTDEITAGTGWLPFAGDWNGDGIDWAGVYDPAASIFKLHNSLGGAEISFTFGTPGAGWKPVAGDWNHDGIDTIGLYDPSTGTFYLRNSNSAGIADVTFTFTGAASTWLPVTGDWNGDGTTTAGLYDPATSTFYLRNSNTTGGADLSFVFGTAGAGLLPEAGDWDGDGVDTIGIYNPSTFQHQLRNQNNAGPADQTFGFGQSGAQPVAGNWNGL